MFGNYVTFREWLYDNGYRNREEFNTYCSVKGINETVKEEIWSILYDEFLQWCEEMGVEPASEIY